MASTQSSTTTSPNDIYSSTRNLFLDLSNNTGPLIMEKQQEMNDIISFEQSRLAQNEQNINDLVNSKERAIQLNMNYIQRKKEFKKILIGFIIALAIVMVFVVLKIYLPIPSSVITLVTIVVFSVFGIFSFNTYVKIQNRDEMDFDKVKMKSPNVLSSVQIQNQLMDNSKISKSGTDVLSSNDLGLCSGSACCANGTVWDVSGQICVKEHFTTEQKGSFIPNEPTEFVIYSIYK